MNKRIFLVSCLLTLLLAIGCFAQAWRPVNGSRQSNISGMALISHDKQKSVFLIAHDNKKPEQTHAATITITGSDAPIYTPLKWIGNDVPLDIEAVASIPGLTGQYILFTAAGRVYDVKLDLAAGQVSLIKSFSVPAIPAESDFEGFDVQVIDGSLIATWADRGETEKPATLFWGRLDLKLGTISDVRASKVRVPLPETNVRHISDLKVDATGAVFIASASDPGNDGPFSSAMYYAGVITMAADRSFVFARPVAFTILYRFPYHKVEAFDFVPGPDGGLVFGADDENLGSAVLLTY